MKLWFTSGLLRLTALGFIHMLLTECDVNPQLNMKNTHKYTQAFLKSAMYSFQSGVSETA